MITNVTNSMTKLINFRISNYSERLMCQVIVCFFWFIDSLSLENTNMPGSYKPADDE